MGTKLNDLALTTGSEPLAAESTGPSFELSVRLDRPFHEQKDYLLAEFERAYLTRCLDECGMNVSHASRITGLSRKHLRTLMLKYGFRRAVIDADDELDELAPQDSAPGDEQSPDRLVALDDE